MKRERVGLKVCELCHMLQIKLHRTHIHASLKEIKLIIAGDRIQ